MNRMFLGIQSKLVSRAAVRSLRSAPFARNFSITRKALNEPIAKGTSPISKETLDASKGMTWESFLKLRKQQRVFNLITSTFTGIGAALFGGVQISQVTLDSSLTIFGFDPLIVAVVTMVGSGALGFLLGPAVGKTMFRLKNRGIISAFEAKNTIFLRHIIKNRVDASRVSVSNPVPDFYGEKISSLKEYKQWLRDCNTYRRREREFF